MKAIFLILLLICGQVWAADEVKIEINPSKPVVGEVFQAIFRIFTESEEEPIINFSPTRVEVVGKNNYGIKTSSVYMNGQFKTTREVTIVYELAASDPGQSFLRDITVQLGNKVIRHPMVTMSVLKEPEVAADVFVMADVPKKSIYLGEGIVVRYYLYSKVQVSNLDIKRYPKLDNFLKRFLQEPDRSERVTVDGQLYLRTQIYGAKLFPEKLGELKVDPLHLSATVLVARAGDPFSGFGFGQERRMKTVSSETIKIQVMPLPEAGKPSNFTGLIGKHDFDLQFNSSKLIVNEPLEVKLTVSGGGALENMEAPAILKHPDLEEFESNGDLKIMDADQATKVFEYTFLPKANLDIPASTLTLSYFDPDNLRYVPVQLDIPRLLVAGGGAGGTKKEMSKSDAPTEKTEKFELPNVPTTLSGPILNEAKSWKSWLNYLNLVLAITAILIAVGLVLKKDKLPSFGQTTIPAEFKRGHFKLNEFTRWLSPWIAQTGKSPLALIKESELSKSTKTYFIDLLNSNDYKDYSHTKGRFDFVYKAEAFKELDQYIQSLKNEDTSRPA